MFIAFETVKSWVFSYAGFFIAVLKNQQFKIFSISAMQLLVTLIGLY